MFYLLFCNVIGVGFLAPTFICHVLLWLFSRFRGTSSFLSSFCSVFTIVIILIESSFVCLFYSDYYYTSNMPLTDFSFLPLREVITLLSLPIRYRFVESGLRWHDYTGGEQLESIFCLVFLY